MDSTPLQIIWSILGAVGVCVLSLIGFGIKKLVTTTFQNTVAVKLLDTHIERLLKGYEKIQKIEEDVNEAHKKIRQIRGSP